jgi:N,N'-diacetyllegionaminate synthase
MHNKVQIIAEIGQAHEGSLGIAHSYIDALAETGVDAVKFQTHIAEAESSEFEAFRVKFSREDATRFDYWKRMEFTPEQWLGLKNHCEEKGMEFISSPFSMAAVELLESIGVKRYKIGSGEVSNHLMLNRIAGTGKEVILSSGLSAMDELEESIAVFNAFGNKLSLLQCTTSYPTQPEEWGLNLIPYLQNKFNLPIGFSDHSGDIFACLAATTLGAEILEFHVVFDKRMFGPDASSSLTIEQVKQLVSGVRAIEKALSVSLEKKPSEDKLPLKSLFEKSLALNCDLNKGAIISAEMLEAKKPKGYGIDAKNYTFVLGRRLKTPKKKWDFLNFEDLDE